MDINPLIPLVGLIVIIGNIVLAAMRPYSPPTFMGIQLFVGGMTTLTVAVVDLLNPIGVLPYERLLLFLAGCINCSIGYYMVLRESTREGV